MRVEIRDLTKTFDAYTALNQVSLDVREGEFCALLGPSGSGKTTLLRIIAGLEFPDRGEVRFAGEDVVRRAARERQVGFVFQHYALFRHMSVFENVAFGLRVRPAGPGRPRRRSTSGAGAPATRAAQAPRRPLSEPARAASDSAWRWPGRSRSSRASSCSTSRSARSTPRSARTCAAGCAICIGGLGLTSVFVTHDQEEALELADQVVLMREGKIEQIGSPRQIYDRPATPFVYEFLGSANRLPCRVRAGLVDVAEVVSSRLRHRPCRRSGVVVRAPARPCRRARGPRRGHARRS